MDGAARAVGLRRWADGTNPGEVVEEVVEENGKAGEREVGADGVRLRERATVSMV